MTADTSYFISSKKSSDLNFSPDSKRFSYHRSKQCELANILLAKTVTLSTTLVKLYKPIRVYTDMEKKHMLREVGIVGYYFQTTRKYIVNQMASYYRLLLSLLSLQFVIPVECF